MLDDIRQFLLDPALRGELLLEAISALGSKHSVDSFRAVLSLSAPIDCSECEARERVAAIERHRGAMETLLGRDPGFTMAAFDLLHEMDRTLRDPVFRDDPSTPFPAEAVGGGTRGHLDQSFRLETRRAERSGRSLAIAVLSPQEPGPQAAHAAGAGFEALRDSARDIDTVLMDEAGDFVVLMPCTGGREGLRAADRFRQCLGVATGTPYCAGVAAAGGRAGDAHVLARHARQALRQARTSGAGASLHRAERRSHPRVRVGAVFGARLRHDGVEAEIDVEDLSLGGALIATTQRFDPGREVVLTLRRPGARPAGFLIQSRVLRVLDGPNPGHPPWKAAVGFSRETRLRVAALLALLHDPRESL